MEEESILTSIKKLLNIDEDDTSFDTDIIIHINSVLMVLTQLGVGPSEGFAITDKEDLWTDFVDESFLHFKSVQTYMFMKVKLVFDPPLSSAVIAAYEKMISEYEWRLTVAAEANKSGEEEEIQNG